MSWLDVLAAVIVAQFPVNFAVTVYLARLSSRAPQLSTLRSRALLQEVLTGVSFIGALLGLAELFRWIVPADWFILALTVTYLGVSFPGLHWAYTYLRDGFR